jgi:type I restriction enzyme M protein
VVIDTGAASRGSGNEGENKEKVIRRWFVENDIIEAVILLPDNLSPSRYVTSLAPTEHRDIQTLLDELAKHQRKAQALDHELASIFTGLGYRWGGENA